VIERGEVWWAELGVARGSEPGYRRPVVIIQSSQFNRSRIRTVIVAAITTNLSLSEAPGNLLLKKRDSKLRRESVINVSQLITLDKRFLLERVSRLPGPVVRRMDEGIRLILGL
jgi:mRNA interferase MazF